MFNSTINQSINEINLYSAFSLIQRRSSVSSKNLSNKNVFKPFRKINNELQHIKLEGKEFQIYGPAYENERLLMG